MVDMAVLKELRGITLAPLKDCKSALEDAHGDIVRAQEILREKGASKAAKIADRATNEGIVVIKQVDTNKVIGIKLACETDFAAKNETFKGIAYDVIELITSLDDIASYDELSDDIKQKATVILQNNAAAIGENMQVLGAFVKTGLAYIYTHPGDKVAAAVFYSGDMEKAKAVALQVAAMQPQFLSTDDISEEVKSSLHEKLVEEMKDSTKPADIVEKIIAGKLQKEWSDIVLLEQTSIIDDSKKVKDMLGDTIIHSYIRLSI